MLKVTKVTYGHTKLKQSGELLFKLRAIKKPGYSYSFSFNEFEQVLNWRN